LEDRIGSISVRPSLRRWRSPVQATGRTGD